MERHLLRMRKNEIREDLIYLGLWTLLFLSPIIITYLRSTTDSQQPFEWAEVFFVWRKFLVYFVIFLVHNFLVAPLLVYRKKRLLYFVAMFCLLVLFQTYQCTHRPEGFPDGGRPEIEGKGPAFAGEHPPMPPKEVGMHDGSKPPQALDSRMHDGSKPPQATPRMHEMPPEGNHQPPVVIGEHDVIAFIVIFLMLGMNIGIKLYFKMSRDSEILDELKNKSLEQQLEYLKYQINPHFFMNTLNNIHALVDINPEQAKDTIVELSKLMRYVLYEGANSTVPLQHEVAFLNNYITLMKIRYTNKVEISVDVPTELPDKNVPPLLFITFVENAFKHGVSYQRDSFIQVKIMIEGDNLQFVCRNRKVEKADDQQGGVGLANVRQRLNLIYGDNHMLHISDDNDIYSVELTIPLTQMQQQ
ncbi:MAG: histidine kinase [Prevotella sp.]|nr:histidine kinase [Prevotella sp.]